MARTYDRVRPPYFAPVLDRAQKALGLARDSRVLDLGAGTGRLTRELVRRFEAVTAVEPDDEMRALIDVGPYRLPIKHELTWTRLRDG